MSSGRSAGPPSRNKRRKSGPYSWPFAQLNIGLGVLIVGSSAIMSIFSSFIYIQRQLHIGIPWFFTYWVTVGAISILFFLAMFALSFTRQLQPIIVIMASFILFVLWMVGLIVISLELWGPSGNVNSNCQLYIENNHVSGTSMATLAWLQQHGICQSWQAAWAFQLIGCAFLVWIMSLATQIWELI